MGFLEPTVLTRESLKFGRNQRLLKSADFNHVFEFNSCKISHSYYLILAKPNRLTSSRLGLVIGKKNINKAVNRNAIKRLVRESFRLSNTPCSVDIVFLARKGADKVTSRELALLLQQSWCRLSRRLENSSQERNA